MKSLVSKQLGKDELTQLEKRLDIYSFSVNADDETITINYRIVVLDLEGNVFKELKTGSYSRRNQEETTARPASTKFDQLKNSAGGAMVINGSTLGTISGYFNIMGSGNGLQITNGAGDTLAARFLTTEAVISPLAGTGNRLVSADANGLLSATTLVESTNAASKIFLYNNFT